MTVIVLEGVNGVGKSTYARKLAAALGATIYRPFRSNSDQHNIEEDYPGRFLEIVGVPIGTHVEDFFTADLLGKLARDQSIRVILDRSLPSALAYGSARPHAEAKNTPGEIMLGLWQEMLAPAKPLYVWLSADIFECARRGTRAPKELAIPFEQLHSRYRYIFEILKMQKLEIGTQYVTPELGVTTILDLLKARKPKA